MGRGSESPLSSTPTFEILCATFGDNKWMDLAKARAIPSAEGQAPVRHLHGATLHDTRNRLITTSTADVLVFVDADDELAPGYIDALAALYAVSKGSPTRVRHRLYKPAVQYIQPDGTEDPPKMLAWKPMPQGNHLVIGTAVSRELAEQVLFQDWPLYEDWDFWWRCIEAGGVVTAATGAVYRYYLADESRNNVAHAEKLEALRVIRAAHSHG